MGVVYTLIVIFNDWYNEYGLHNSKIVKTYKSYDTAKKELERYISDLLVSYEKEDLTATVIEMDLGLAVGFFSGENNDEVLYVETEIHKNTLEETITCGC